MQLGIIQKSFGKLSVCASGWANVSDKLDLNLALQYYGFLVTHNETITTIEWIKRIRKTYASSPKRNHLIRAIVNTSRKTLPKRLTTTKGN